MSDDRSILHRMNERGRPARRVTLKGTQRSENATDRYEIVGELARGGVGIVHRGRDNDLGRDVALKVLRDGNLGNPEMVQRFVEEAQIGGQLQHPGIVPVYELGLRADQRPYFAMKLVKGETLAARLAKGTEKRRALLAVFRDVCRTVAYAHARGVIHRDLKPSNVMIGNFGEVQVVDWGFAKVLRRGGVADERLANKAERDITMISTVRSDEGSAPSVAGSVMGTPAYMPPEQALGRVEDLDEKSDLFSLGAILAEILTGKPPYTGADRMGDAEQALLEPMYRRLDECDADGKLVDLCKRCLRPLPKDRPASAEALADEVAAYLTSADRRSHRARLRSLRAGERAAAQRRARRLTTMTGASVAAALLIALATYFWIDAGRRDRARARHAKTEAALQDAARLQAAEQWDGALAAAERAVALGDDGALAREIRAQAEAAEIKRSRLEEEEGLLNALERARALRSDHYDKKVIDAAWRKAVGADLKVDTARLRGSGNATAFAAAFDAWAVFRRKNHMDWKHIDAWARAIDPAHDGLRDAMAAEDGALKRLLKTTSPDDLPVALISALGQVLLERDEGELAFAFLLRAHRTHPGDFWINFYLGYVAEGHFWEREPRLDVSIRHYTAALAVRPDSIEARHRLGLALCRSGAKEAALGMWRDALALQPRWGHGLSHVAEILLEQDKADEALALALKAIEYQSDDPAVHVVYGNLLDDTGDPDGAIAAYNRAIAVDDEYSMAYYNRGNVEFKLGQHHEAVGSCRRAIELGSRGGPRLTLGAALLALRDTDGAIAAYREATRVVGPSAGPAFRAAAFRGLGAALRQKGDIAASLEAKRAAVDAEPENATNHYDLGTGLMFAHRPEPALVALKRALDLRPTAETWCNIGSCYEQLGKWPEAVVAFRKGHELGSKREDFHYPAPMWLARAKLHARLAPRLPAVLDGKDSPADWEEAAAFASMAVRSCRYPAAVRLFRQAFASNPTLHSDVRYTTDAACAAVAAGAEFHGQALEWARVSLDTMRAAVARVPHIILMNIDERWRRDVLLAPVRDAADLPDGWKRFWADLEALRAQAKAALK